MRVIEMENRSEFIEDFANIIVKNEMRDGPTVDIYIYVFQCGFWKIRELENPEEGSFLCDGSVLIYRIPERSGNDELNRKWPTRKKEITEVYIDFFSKNIDEFFEKCLGVKVRWIE